MMQIEVADERLRITPKGQGLMRISMSRRRTISAAISVCAALTLSVQAQSFKQQMPVTVSTERQLFIDDSLVEARSNVVRVMHQPVKVLSPVLVGDHPWENWTVDLFGIHSIHYDETQKLYRMWYTGYDVAVDNYYTCYATSKDGIHWTKPILGLNDFKGSKENNIVNPGRVFWPNSTVLIDDHDPDPDRRYKSLSWDFGPATAPVTIPSGFYRPSGNEEYRKGRPIGMSVAFSPDGLHWTPYNGNPVIKGAENVGDTNFLLGWDPRYDKYVAYPRPSYQASGGIRVIGFSTSDDFIHWSPPEIILRPDSQDSIADEFYGMPVTKYEGKYIGFLWVYHNSPNLVLVKSPSPLNENGSQQTLDTQLTYSEDGKHFIRVGDRQPFLPDGPAGSWDRGMVTVSDMLVHGNELWIYYGGWGSRHNDDGKLLGKIVNGHRLMGAVGLAKLRLDGFVSLHAGDHEGIVLTRQIQLHDQNHLRINAEASHGSIAVELLDEKLDPIAGFGRDDSQLMNSDSISSEMKWRGHADLSGLQGRAVRIRIYLRNADLYSIQLN